MVGKGEAVRWDRECVFRGGNIMSHIYLIAYAIAGLLAAGMTMKVFPPMEGFRPGLAIRLLAVLIFSALWPVLLLLGGWYFVTGYFRAEPKPTPASAAIRIDLVGAKAASWQGSKPR